MRNVNTDGYVRYEGQQSGFILTMRNVNSRDRLVFDNEEEVLY